QSGCALCGQCITHCPTAALTERCDIDKVIKALLDPSVMTVVQVAPAVRAAWGEAIDRELGDATPGRMASALRALGFDHVFDTDFAADLTIMEEGSEFIEFLGSDKPRPMFTSCCPGWVRFAKLHFPEILPQLSSAKSPHQMLGAVVKNIYGKDAEAEGKSMFCMSIMPCLAKKFECEVPQLSTDVGSDVDAVLTVRELDHVLRMFQVNCSELEETPFDSPLGMSTGAATIFGRSGGVMEAALRTAVTLITGTAPSFDDCDCTAATPEIPWMSKELDVNGTIVRIAVASGLSNTAKLLDALKSGEASFDFVEVMACPSGCVGGGGQPIKFDTSLAGERADVLNTLDANDTIRMSHENPEVAQLYADWLGSPLSHTSHDWLHTDQIVWEIPGRD
ncbi:MAG: iron hydrogenase small subunit, partial [Coriobacteriia bacterium]|nr:iron hydrogenase small subunit [Coriobacteriia bacterium]